MAYNIQNLSSAGKGGFNVKYAFSGQALNNDVAAFNAFRKALYGDFAGRHKRRLEKYLNAIMASHFAAEEDASGSPWAELSEATFDNRRAAGAWGVGPKLIFTRGLFDAATHVSIKSTQGSNKVIYIQPNNGSSLNKKLSAQFAVHNQPTSTKTSTGSSAFGNVTVPGREFFYLRENYVSPIAELIVEDAIGALRGTMQKDSFIQLSTGYYKASSSGLRKDIRNQLRRMDRRKTGRVG